MRKWYPAFGIVVTAAGLLAVWQLGFHGVHPLLILRPPPVSRPPPTALDDPAWLDVTDVPLRQVLSQLAERHDVEIALDIAGLSNERFTGDEPVTFKLDGVSLRSLLTALMRQVDSELFVGVRDGAVHVTTRASWNDTLNNYVSQVHVLAPLMSGPGEFNEQRLADLIQTTIAPWSWEDVGGLGVMEVLPGALIVSQTPDKQEQIEELLSRLADLQDNPSVPSPVYLDGVHADTNQQIRAALNSATSFECIEEPLAEVLTQLSVTSNTAIVLDRSATLDVGLDGDTPVTCKLSGISLRSALNLFLSQLELTFLIRDGVLLVTTPEEAESQLEIRLYRADDLLGLPHFNQRTLIEAIKSCIAPQAWDDVGRPGAADRCGNVLVIAQTRQVHEQVEGFLSGLRRAVWPTQLAYGASQPAAVDHTRDRIEATLRQSVSLYYNKTLLSAALAGLAEQFGINVWLDVRALEGEGVASDTRLTFTADNEPLESVLRILLHDLELTFEVRDDSLVITTQEEAEAHLETRFFRVRQIPSGNRWTYSSGDLKDAITSTIFPDSWDDVGGPGSIEVLGDVLAVSQTREVHQQFKVLLTALDDLRSQPSAIAPIDITPPPDDRSRRILQALDEPASLDAIETPLAPFARYVSEQHNVPIHLDLRALDEFGIVADSQVTDSITGVSLRSALNLLLHAVDQSLAIQIRDGRLWITSYDEAASQPELRVYPVRDLCPPNTDHTSEDLADAVMDCVDALAWDQVGGSGSIAHLPGVLIVANTSDVHRRIEHLLAGLRDPKPPIGAMSSIPIDNFAGSRRERIAAALREPTHFTFDKLPLEDVVRQLADKQNVPIRLDRRALDNAGIREQEPISAIASGDWLEVALERLLAPLDLSIVEQDEVLLITSSDVADGLVRLYPVADLIELDRRRLPHDALNNALLEPSGGWPHLLRDEGRDIDELLDCCAWTAGPNFARSQGEIGTHFADSLLFSGRRQMHRDCELVLSNLRRVLRQDTDSPPQAELSLTQPSRVMSWESVETPAFIQAYDVRPLLKRFPELEQRQLVSLVTMVVAPSSWIEATPSMFDPKRKWRLTGDGIAAVDCYRGVMVVRQSSENQAEVADFLAWLAEPPETLPRPYEFARDNNRPAVQRLTDLIRTPENPLTRAYSVALLATIDDPTPEAAAALTELLAATDMDRDLELTVCRAIGHFGPVARDAAKVLERKIATAADPVLRRAYFATLLTIGPAAEHELARAAKTASGGEMHLLLRWSYYYSPRTAWMIPIWLERLASNSYADDLNRFAIETINTIDPKFERSLAVVELWKQNPQAEHHDRAVQIETLLLERRR